MRPRSLRFRLTGWYAGILAATFAVAGILVWWTIRDSIHETVDSDLRSLLLALRAYLDKQAADAALAPAGPRYRLAGTDGRWVYQSPETLGWDPKPPDASRLPKSGKTQTIVVDKVPLRVLSAPVSMGTVQIGTPLDEFYEMLDEFTWTALIASPFLLLLAAAGGYWMSGRVLKPVDRISRTAERIEAQSLSDRLPLSGAGDELDRLSATLNSMFGRLDASFRRMAEFTADASHELRTPVAVIQTTAEVARSKPRTEEEYAKALDRILVESQRTTRLIEDLMLLARADAGADGMVLEPMDLAHALREACAAAKVLAEAAHVHLIAEEFCECLIRGDDAALRRLLLILLDNAVKYTPPGGSVTVSMSVEERAGEKTAVVEVRDTGIGIAPEDLPHIFDRFYRVAKDRSRTTGGAGLGLSIARWIATRHGGEIRAESAPGAGSVFRVRIPAGR